MADYYASIFGTEKDKISAKAQGDEKKISDEEDQKHFDEFFEDIYVELEEKHGPIEEMNVCDNLGDHLIGNVYVKFKHEEDAAKAVDDLNNRWFAGKPVYAELSTVTDFREAACRLYETGTCTRCGFCNFMHLKQISNKLKKELLGDKYDSHRSSRRSRRSRSKSPISPRSKSRSRSISMPRSRSRSRSASSSHSRHHHRRSSRRRSPGRHSYRSSRRNR